MAPPLGKSQCFLLALGLLLLACPALFAEGNFLYGRMPQAVLLTVVFVVSATTVAVILSKLKTSS